ncbi:hypothetical protein NR756_04795 [Alloalcanivorax xenomutans]|jgi:hypothetical protein|uniref:hypothetical protein n=1 Tax=Alloalcanivorax xenomutans TaxID=1094342 RepID=UPI0011C05B6D
MPKIEVDMNVVHRNKIKDSVSMDIKPTGYESEIVDRVVEWLINDYGDALSERGLGEALDYLLENLPGFEVQNSRSEIKKVIISEYRRYGKDGRKD